jgi:hypothetical protein
MVVLFGVDRVSCCDPSSAHSFDAKTDEEQTLTSSGNFGALLYGAPIVLEEDRLDPR